MSSTHRWRNSIIGIIIVIIVLILIVRGIVERRREAARERIDNAVEMTSGSGGSQQPQQQSGTSEQSSSSSADSGDSSDGGQSGVLAPPQEPPEAEIGGPPVPAEDSPAFLEILDQNVTPFMTTPGHNMAFWASISGTATSVTMTIEDTAGVGGAFSVQLVSGPAGPDATSWSFNGQAPSVPGTYSYSTTAVGSDGHSIHRQGATVIVEQ